MEPIHYSDKEIRHLEGVFSAAKALLLSPGCNSNTNYPNNAITTDEALNLLDQLDAIVACAPSSLFSSL
jgi:hypothetical protein